MEIKKLLQECELLKKGNPVISQNNDSALKEENKKLLNEIEKIKNSKFTI